MKVKLSDAFDLQMGKTPPRNDRECWGDGYKWISISDIGNAGKYIDKTKEEITDVGVSKSGIKVVPKGTVIMSFKLSIGKTAITAEDMYTNEAIMAFISKGKYEITADYLYHMCKGIDWFEGTNKAVLGLTLNKATMSEKKIEIPPLDVQLQVVAVLDKMDELITLRKEQLAKLDRLVKSRFIELFGSQCHNEKQYPYGKIDDVAEIYLGLTHTPEYIETGVKFISAKNTSCDYLDLSDVKYISREEYASAPAGAKPRKGDVLFSRVGSNLGHPVILDIDEELCTFVSLGYLRTKGSVTNLYLKHWMRDDFFAEQVRRKVVGGGQPNLNTGWLKEFRIIIPPLDLQQQFAAFVEQTDKSKLAIQQSLDKLELLKKSLMQEYFG